MSQLGWNIFIISVCWLAGCYYFLFRKRSDKISKASSRSESEVITFYKPEELASPDAPSHHISFPESVTLYTETIIPSNASDPPKDSHAQVNDEDLIDIRTLSLNITNEN